METVVGARIIRKSNVLELVVQHRVSSSNARATTQGRTHKAGNPETHIYFVASFETKSEIVTSKIQEKLVRIINMPIN